MLRTGDWITPSYDGQVSLDNPPLFLQLMAGSFLLFGVRDYAAILPSALSGVLCVVLLHALARRLRFGSFAAWAAAVVLLTTQYFLKYSRHAMFDVFLTLLFLLAIGAYLPRARGGRGTTSCSASSAAWACSPRTCSASFRWRSRGCTWPGAGPGRIWRASRSPRSSRC